MVSPERFRSSDRHFERLSGGMRCGSKRQVARRALTPSGASCTHNCLAEPLFLPRPARTRIYFRWQPCPGICAQYPISVIARELSHERYSSSKGFACDARQLRGASSRAGEVDCTLDQAPRCGRTVPAIALVHGNGSPPARGPETPTMKSADNGEVCKYVKITAEYRELPAIAAALADDYQGASPNANEPCESTRLARGVSLTRADYPSQGTPRPALLSRG